MLVSYGASFLRCLQGFTDHETNIPTEQPQAEQDARLSHPDADERRPQRLAPPTPEGARTIGGLTGPSKGRFEEIFQNGRVASTTCFRLYSLPGTGLLGVATARSIGNRPKRNRAKRRAKEAFRLVANRPDFLDFVLVVKGQAVPIAFEQVQREVEVLIGRSVELWGDESESS